MEIQTDNATNLTTEILCPLLHVYLNIMPLENIEPSHQIIFAFTASQLEFVFE